MRPRYLTLPIALVLLAIGYLYYATVFVVLDDWLGLASAAGIANAATLSFLTLASLVNYAMAIYTNPGSVPPSFIPDVEDTSHAPIHEIKRKSGDRRFCQKCSHYKPPRAHHCRVCKRCVLRMDHHCVWINNCVGHANYKVFFVFVLYAVLACIHSMIVFVGSVVHDVHRDQQQNGGSFKTSYIICGLLLFPLTFATSILLGWHIYLILHNKTTIEYHEGVRALCLAEKGGNIYRHPYDLGAYDNLSSVLGPNILCWVCPTSGHIGMGLRYRTSYDNMISAPPR